MLEIFPTIIVKILKITLIKTFTKLFQTYLNYILYIVGHSCADHNIGEKIQSNNERKCNGADFDVKCPFNFFANEIYLCKFLSILK